MASAVKKGGIALKKRIAKKIENRNFDLEKFYAENYKWLVDAHSGGVDFWLTVKKYARKSTSRTIAERAYQKHSGYYERARRSAEVKKWLPF